MHEAGKGSRQRPIHNKERFYENWDRIFGGVSSPCVEVCRLDYVKKICTGCLRTLDEIAAWGQMQEADRRAVWGRIAKRLARPSERHS